MKEFQSPEQVTETRDNKIRKSTTAVAAAATVIALASGCSETVTGNAIAADTRAMQVQPNKTPMGVDILELSDKNLCRTEASNVDTLMLDLKMDSKAEQDTWVCQSEFPRSHGKTRTFRAYGQLILNSPDSQVAGVVLMVMDDKNPDGSGSVFEQNMSRPGAQQISATEYYIPATPQSDASDIKLLTNEQGESVVYAVDVVPSTDGDHYSHGFPTDTEMSERIQELMDDTVTKVFPNYTGTN